MAQAPLEARLYSSLVSGVSDKHAIAFTRPMVELLARQLDYPINFELANGESAEDLFQFGGEIDAGACHVGVIWGLEYGWLREQFPRLKPLVLLSQSIVGAYRSEIMVREDFDAEHFPELRKTRLAMYQRTPLQDRLFLEELVEQSGQTVKAYFRQVKEYPTAKSAILAVCQKEADCVLLNIMAYSHHVANRPKLKLRGVVLSEPFPMPVLVGRPDLIDALRPGLWSQVQQSLERIHLTAEGRQCMDFWRQDRFVRPDQENFEQLVRQRVHEYPITLLQRLAPNGRP